MTNYEHIFALDPSGNFHEGKGTTGYAVYNCSTNKICSYGLISSKDYPSMEAYWEAHLSLLDCVLTHYSRVGVVIEDYLLYGTKASNQINSRMETPKLIGVLQYALYQRDRPYHMQPASEVKTRWANNVLVHRGIIVPIKQAAYALPGCESLAISKHTLDAIRHAVHYANFKNKRRAPNGPKQFAKC